MTPNSTKPPDTRVAKRQNFLGTELNTLRTPRYLHLILEGRDGVYKDRPYELWANGVQLAPDDARTKETGEIKQELPDDVDKVLLKVWFDWSGVPDEFELEVGDLPPASSEEGRNQRLRNLGSGWVEGALAPEHVDEFQELEGRDRNGKLGDGFAGDLEALYGN